MKEKKTTWLYNDLQRIIIQRLHDVSKREHSLPLDSLQVNDFLRDNRVVLKHSINTVQTELDELINNYLKEVTKHEDSSSNGPLWKF